MSSDLRNPIEVMAEEFAQRLRDGEEPTIEEYSEKHPDKATLIRAVFGPLLAMERVGHQEHAERVFESRTVKLAEHSRQLGDFRILRQIGRGGMGIVYEAIQLSLNRRVALKVLGPNVSGSSNQLRRFQLEAEAAAKLHHTNIVPVYGISESDGLHFYAMQHIEGVSLSDALATVARQQYEVPGETLLADGNVPVSITGEMSSDSAESALSNAGPALNGLHSNNGEDAEAGSTQVELHRASYSDTVNSDSSDGACKLDISSDFELENALKVAARKSQQSYFRSVAEIGMHVARALAYAHENGVVHRDIKPANLMLDTQGTVWITDFGLAKHLEEESNTKTGDIVGTIRYMAPEQFSGKTDGRSDICSLGLTLFEMLALRPAFRETMHAHLIKAKTTEDVPKLRSLSREIPRDLETIVARACASNPSERYQDAGVLADDLDRFLTDRPILARQQTAIEKVYRWAKKNPAVAALSATIVGVLTALVIVFAVGKSETQEALELAKAMVDVSELERQRATTNEQMAMEAFDELIEKIAARGGVESLPIELTDGSVAYGTGMVSEADAELLQSLLPVFDRFARENASDLSARTAATHRRLGDIHSRLGKLEKAEAAYMQAFDLYGQLTTKSDSSNATVVEQLRLLNSLSLLAFKLGKINDATRYYFAAKELSDLYPDVMSIPGGQFELARASNTFTVGHTSVSAAGLKLRDGLKGTQNRGPRQYGRFSPGKFRPNGPGGTEGISKRGYSRPLSDRLRNGGSSRIPDELKPLARMEELANANAEAIALLTALVKDDASNATYSFQLAQALREQVRVGRMTGQREPEKDQAAMNKSIRIMEGLVSEYPDSPNFKYVLAETYSSLASIRSLQRSSMASMRATRLANELVREYPNVPDYRALKAGILTQRGDYRSVGDAYAMARGLVRESPASVKYNLVFANSAEKLAAIEAGNGNESKAQEYLQSAIDSLKVIDSQSQAARFVGRYLTLLESTKKGLE